MGGRFWSERFSNDDLKDHLKTTHSQLEVLIPCSFLKTSSQIVSALSRYPVARARTGGSREKYDTAAQTAFTGREDHTHLAYLDPFKRV